MSSQESVFFQEILIGSADIDMARLVEGTYIECTDLSGPKLILKFNDVDSSIRDDGKLAEGAQIKVTLGSPNGTLPILQQDFTVLSYVNEKDVLTINCLLTAVYDLKTKRPDATFFVNKQVDAIAKDLIPLKVNSDSVPLQQTYHLTPNITPAQLLRLIARENDVLIYVSRGEVFIKKRADIVKTAPVIATYEHNGSGAEYVIRSYNMVRLAEHYRRRLQRTYVGWSMKDGVITTTGEGAAVLSSLSTKEQLESLPRYMLPILEFVTNGNDALVAGAALKLTFHRFFTDRVLDESIPEKSIVTKVCHNQYGLSYSCVVEVGVSYDQ